MFIILPTNLQTQRAEDNSISLEKRYSSISMPGVSEKSKLFPAEFVSLQDDGRCWGVRQCWAVGLSLQSLQVRGGQREVEGEGRLGELTEQGGGVGRTEEA